MTGTCEGAPVAVGASGLSSAPAGMESMQKLNEEALKRRVDSQPTSAGAGAGDAVSAGDAQITDIWLAGWYVTDFKGAFQYDHSCKQYRAFQGGSWVVCTRGEYIEAAKKFGAMLLEKAIVKLRADSQSGASKRLMACAIRAQSAGGIDAALRLAQSDPAIAVSAEDFDKDPAMFNCANGVIDLRTGVLIPHNPALMVSRQSPVAYYPDARCPMFDKFMHEISCSDPDWEHYFQRVMGYSLSGYVTEEKLFVWIGPGANGKSVVGNIQQHIMGGYGGVAPASFLMRQREGNSNGATPEIANLMGKRMVSANEVESGSKLSVQTVKNVVSTETITARHLYGGPFTFTPTHKLNLRVNHRPGITDTDEGCWRRLDLIPFDMNLSPAQRDQGLEARLMAEAPGILAWMVRGFQNWQREGLTPARRVLEASLAYRNESDLLGQWVSEACTLGGSFAADQILAYRQYVLWAESQGLRAYTKVSFTRGLSEQGFRAGRQGGGLRCATYIGFRLNGA